jgi:hypothetical protein
MPKLHTFRMLAVAIALLFSARLAAQSPIEPGYIVLKRVVGEVFVAQKATSVREQAANDRRIEQGTIVTTAAESSVILVFSNGATVNLGARSELDIEEFLQDPFAENQTVAELTEEPSVSRTKLRLSRGELVGQVKKLKKEAGSSFVVETPAGAAGIRGTTFRIAFQTDQAGGAVFSVTTLEGEVGFSTLTGSLDAPQAIVADNQEVVVDVAVNPQTGAITVLTPLAAIVARPAAPAQIAAMANAVQQIVEAIAQLVLPPKSAGAGGGAGTTNNFAPTEPQNSAVPPPLGRTSPDLTPGDGAPGG